MKTHQVATVEAGSTPAGAPAGFPGQASLAALRPWYAGLNARAAVAQYLGHDKADGQSSRAMLGAIRKQLAGFARARHREDLAELLEHPAAERLQARPGRSAGHRKHAPVADTGAAGDGSRGPVAAGARGAGARGP